MNRRFLIIGQVWPEPDTTGAGLRMMQLISMLQDMGMDLHFSCTAQRTEYSAPLEKWGVACSEIKLNHPSFDSFVADLRPDYVMFDRFATEEQFSWRVAEHCPEAMRILDTEDLHFLRASRRNELELPVGDKKGNTAEDIKNRELASICRSDLTLVISEYEMNYLRGEFGLDPGLLFYLPFVVESKDLEGHEGKGFDQREGFLFMGNWKHGPNRDAVFYLKERIWPLIKREMPEAKVYVYGAYAQKDAHRLSDAAAGFHLMGWAPDKRRAYQDHRVCLAPVRYGAGLKGKLFDAMRFGTPNVSSSMAAEGIAGELDWAGLISDDPGAFASAAQKLYSDAKLWEASRLRGYEILKKRFSRDQFYQMFLERLHEEKAMLSTNRKRNWIGSMLWHHSLQSAKYLAKWIEAKNKDH